jgi:hypothetical protein
LNALGIDPALTHDFKREWLFFQSSPVKKFLVCWLEKELGDAHRVLENVAPEGFGKAQGIVVEIKKMLNLVELKFCDDPLKDLLAYLEKKER